MAKYDVTFSCGHTETIQLFGKETDRQRKISWYEKHGLCPECHRKQQEEAKKAVAEKAAAEASKFGLPELTGTPKQIAWADEIRLQIVKSINDCNNRLLDVADEAKAFGRPDVQPDIDNAIRLVDAFSQVISSEKSASKIIDWHQKCTDVFKLVKVNKISVAKDIISGKKVPEDFDQEYGGFFVEALRILYSPDPKATTENKEDSVILAPKEKKSGTLVTVTYTETQVTVESPKDPTVIQTVKAAGFRWNDYAWKLDIDVLTGKASDRAAEIANKLLNAGYQVTVPASIRQAAVSGNYEPRCTRWISRYKDDDDHVYVSWNRDDDMYYHAKEITGAKWVSRRGMRVPTSSADEIEDFAQLYGFQITDGAKEAIAEYRKSVTIVAPESGKTAEKKDGKEALDNILKSSRDVIEDLKDD